MNVIPVSGCMLYFCRRTSTIDLLPAVAELCSTMETLFALDTVSGRVPPNEGLSSPYVICGVHHYTNLTVVRVCVRASVRKVSPEAI